MMFFPSFKVVIETFQDFTPYDNNKNTGNGFLIKTTNVGPDDITNGRDDKNLKEELCCCQQFLVDSELELSRHKVFN